MKTGTNDDLFGRVMSDDEVRRALSQAKWIQPCEDGPAPAGERPAMLLRARFLGSDARWIFATAHGVYELYLNGVRLGDQELTPGFTAYRKRLEVQRFDLSGQVRPGWNTLVAVLSDGWFRGRHGFQRGADGFGDRTALLVAVIDGKGSPVMATGPDWWWRPSHITRADLMDGQAIDFRRFDPRWFTEDAGEGWRPVETCMDDPRTAILVAPSAPPVRRLAELPPASTTRPRPGTVVLDFGQNMNGWVRLVDLGPAGTTLTLTHGEALDADGLVTTEHLRAFNFATHALLPAGQIDEVTSAGRPSDVFEPRHTTHGFRYVQVDGIPEGLSWDGARAVMVGTDLRRTGEFRCSDARLERLHEVVRASLVSNTCAVPTDCPQRERSGFTGDWQIFVGTAALMADVSDFSQRWLRDLAADQWPDGRVPTIVPNPGGDRPSGDAFEDASAGSAGWGDAAAIVPWELWRAYGDVDGLREAYPAMRNWVRYAARAAASGRHPLRAAARPVPAAHETYLWDTGFHFGEWLEPDVPPHPDPTADHSIVATAYLSRSASIAAATARLVGTAEEAEEFDAIARGAASAWQAEFLTASGEVATDRQAPCVRALAFGLVPPRLRPVVAGQLARLVAENDDRLNTGFLSTGLLLQALADHGRGDVAWRLLTRTGHPSWLGMIDDGATTMWEHWDAVHPDGTVTGSLNHYSKGAVASFLHTHVAGLRLPEFPTEGEAGYQRVDVVPFVPEGLTHASTRQETARGPVSVGWRLEGDRFTLEVDVPEGTVGSVTMPDGAKHGLVAGGMTLACAWGLR